MAKLDDLAACAGTLRGTNRLFDPNTNQPVDTPSTAVVTPLLGGRFVRIDYTWSYGGEPQEGSMLVGYESDPGKAAVHWIDSWHNGEKVMVCTGTLEQDGVVNTLGSFPAPPGPDWGWRIILRAGFARPLEVIMKVISPEGEESPAVEARYEGAGK